MTRSFVASVCLRILDDCYSSNFRVDANTGENSGEECPRLRSGGEA